MTKKAMKISRKKNPKDSDVPLPFDAPEGEEDDHNSIDSGETTVKNDSEDNNDQCFLIWRFRLVIEIPPVSQDLLEKKRKEKKCQMISFITFPELEKY